MQAETGCSANFENARLLGVFQHFYPTNRFALPGYGTHYIVLAYEVRIPIRPAIRLDSQHTDYRWMSEAEIQAAPDVHQNTKTYFSLCSGRSV
jgi:colanic acid biosynthesis protein WcaH